MHPDVGARRTWDDFDSYTLNIDAFEPINLSDSVIGRELSSFPERKLAAASSMRSGEPRFSSTIPLFEDRTKAVGFQLVVPAYSSVTIPAPEAARLSAGIGWTYIPLVATAVLAGTTEAAGDGIDVSIFDGETQSPESLIFKSDIRPPGSSNLNASRHSGCNTRMVLPNQCVSADL